MCFVNEQVKKVIKDTQDSVLNSLKECSHLPVVSSNRVLEVVSQCSEEMLGKLEGVGKTLKNFVKVSNLRHPDIANITSQQEWGDLSMDVSRIFAGATDVQISKYKPLVRQFFSPKPRFITDVNHRNTVRREKKCAKHIGLKKNYMTGDNSFYSRSASFDVYVRNNNVYKRDIDNLDKQRKVFSARGMNEVAHSIKKRISDIEEAASCSYLGFNRLKPTDCAISAARMLGLTWHDLYCIIIPFKSFKNPYWETATGRDEVARIKEETKKLMIMHDRRTTIIDSTAFSFQPRLYPVSMFADMPIHVKEVLGRVEAMPELNGCPAFDYYWLLVPSININHPYFRANEVWKVYVEEEDEQRPWNAEKGHFKTFHDEYEAALALDKCLVKDGYSVPVVLGEREGKCYFITIWS